MFKTDLRRAYRHYIFVHHHITLWHLFGKKKHIFCDTVLTMGSRSSAFCCQRLTSALAFIMYELGFSILNYLDDLASAKRKENASFAFDTLQSILQKCGVEEAKNKVLPPSTIMSLLGVLFNTEKNDNRNVTRKITRNLTAIISMVR